MAKTKVLRNIKPSTNAVFWGLGNSGDYYNMGATANQNAVEWRLKTYAASGDTRGIYARVKFYGAGGGEVGRFFANASTTNVATGGTLNGIHTSMSVDTSSSISGAANGLRSTLGAAAATRTLSGALAAIQADSDIGTGNTLPAIHGFIRFTNSGAVALSNLMVLPSAPANGTIFAAHVTDAMTHSIKVIDSAGTAYYLMATTTVTNRS